MDSKTRGTNTQPNAANGTTTHPSSEAKDNASTTSTKKDVMPFVLPKERLQDVGRIAWILSHRNMLHQAALMATPMFMKEHQIKSFITASAPGIHNSRPVKNAHALKSIKLEEVEKKMDRCTQHTFKGRIIKLMSIEDCSVGQQSTRLVVGDDAGDTYRVCIYNYPHDSFPNPPSPDKVAILQKNLGFGSMISIMNPYVKMALDGAPYIRVDNPSTIIHHPEESKVNRCRYCGEPDVPHRCSLCRRHYCSRDCQKNDWKINQHKLICSLKFREL